MSEETTFEEKVHFLSPLLDHGDSSDTTLSNQNSRDPSQDPSTNLALATFRCNAVIAPRPASTQVAQPGPTLQPIQLWAGTVKSVGSGEFTALVQDYTNRSNPDEEVVFDLAEVDPSDRSLVTPGSGFYWVVGRERTPAGTQKNLSQLRFRRLPGTTTSTLRRAKQRAARLMAAFAGPGHE